MLYKHNYFLLDSDKKEVFDENNRKLRLTGNAYRLLVFLCKKTSANITEIGDDLDSAKDYDENHIRQYRHKINTVIGCDVVKYENKMYSICGEIKEFERNTDLLQQDDVKLETNNKKVVYNNLKFNIAPAIIAIISLLLTLIDWSSYGYYTLMKIVVTGVMAYYAWYLYTEYKKRDFWFWIFVVITILFNPFVPIYLGDKGIWMVIDLAVVIFLIMFVIKFRKIKR